MMSSFQSMCKTVLKKASFTTCYRQVIQGKMMGFAQEKACFLNYAAYGLNETHQKISPPLHTGLGLMSPSTTTLANLSSTTPHLGKMFNRPLFQSTAKRNREVLKNEAFIRMYEEAIDKIRSIQKNRESMMLETIELKPSLSMARPGMYDNNSRYEIKYCAKPRLKVPVQSKPAINKVLSGRVTKAFQPYQITMRKNIKKRIKLAAIDTLPSVKNVQKCEDYFKTQLNRVDKSKVNMINEFADIARASKPNKSLNFLTATKRCETKPIETTKTISSLQLEQNKPFGPENVLKIKDILERASSLKTSRVEEPTVAAKDTAFEKTKPKIAIVSMEHQGLKQEFAKFCKTADQELNEVEMLNEFATLQMNQARKAAKLPALVDINDLEY